MTDPIEDKVRAVSSPWMFNFYCPFCGKTEVSMFTGKVEFSAIVCAEELTDSVKLTIAGLMCSKSHIFFVKESDMAAVIAASAA